MNGQKASIWDFTWDPQKVWAGLKDKYIGQILAAGHKHQVLYALDSGGVVQALGVINLAEHLSNLAPTT